MGLRQSQEYFFIFLHSDVFRGLAGQDQVRVQVVRHQGGRQVAEIQLQDGCHAVNVVKNSWIRCQIGNLEGVKLVPWEQYSGQIQLMFYWIAF